MTDEEARKRPMLERPSKLVELGEVAEQRGWWRLRPTASKGPVSQSLSLVQDGEEIATVSTTLQPDTGAGRKGLQCRRTEVRFTDESWIIRTHVPPPPDRTRARTARRRRWREDRIVEALRASPEGVDEGDRIAFLSQPSAWSLMRPVTVETVDGLSVTLTPQSAGRRFLTGEMVSIRKVKGGYSLTPKSPVPYAAALVHWHVMLGDLRPPRPGWGSPAAG